jgi:hypothetical protein
VKKRLQYLIFVDAALVRWKKGQPIKAFRRERSWTNKDHPRAQQLGGFKLYQFYSALTKGPEGALHRHPLIFVPATSGLDSKLYVKEVAKPVLAWARGVFGGPGFQIVQDNASCHTAEYSEEWMELNDYMLHDHPPQSPDLNRIEKAWAHFKNQLLARRPRPEKGFHQAMQDVWMGLDKRILMKFINQLPDVMAKVHACPKKQVQM